MNYSISAGHIETARAAETVLQSGGNAVDAALAALAVSFVSEPCMSGAGAGGFAMVRSPDHKPYLYDFFCKTPMQKRPAGETEFIPVSVDFGSTTETYYSGRGAIACPGTVDGMFTLHAHWGKMPLKEIVQAATGLARNGVKLTSFQHYYLSLLTEILSMSPVGKEIFFENERLKEPGDRLVMYELADVLEVLAIEGRDLFYRGEIAQTAVRSIGGKGHLNLEDFEQYETSVRKPLVKRWNHWRWYSNPEPALGGAMQWAVIKEWSERMERNVDFSGVKEVLQHVEALRTQPDRLFKMYFNRPYELTGMPDSNSKYGSTTHFNVIDEKGLGIGITLSIGEGSGYFIPGTGIQLNNCLGETALLPGGLHSWLPARRLISLMSPTLLQHEDRNEFLLLGTPGAGRIPSALAQVVLNYCLYGMDLDKAVEAPRAHWQEGVFAYEKEFFDDRMESGTQALGNVTVWPEQHLFFGGVQASLSRNGTMQAVSDPRREGGIRVQ